VVLGPREAQRIQEVDGRVDLHEHADAEPQKHVGQDPEASEEGREEPVPIAHEGRHRVEKGHARHEIEAELVLGEGRGVAHHQDPVGDLSEDGDAREDHQAREDLAEKDAPARDGEGVEELDGLLVVFPAESGEGDDEPQHQLDEADEAALARIDRGHAGVRRLVEALAEGPGQEIPAHQEGPQKEEGNEHAELFEEERPHGISILSARRRSGAPMGVPERSAVTSTRLPWS
jgi:hypothetical protein